MSPKDTDRKTGRTAEGIRNVGQRITNNPGAALLAALAVGFVVGLVLRMLEKSGRGERRGS